MDKSFRDKIIKESEKNENDNKGTRKSVKKSWLNFGTDKVDMDRESRRVVNQIHKLMEGPADTKWKEYYALEYDDYIPEDEDDEPDVNNNVRSSKCLDEACTVIVKGESLIPVVEVHPSMKHPNEISKDHKLLSTEKWVLDTKEDFVNSVHKEEIIVNPEVTELDTVKKGKVDTHKTNNSIPGGSKPQNLQQIPVSSAKTSNNANKQNCSKNIDKNGTTKKQFQFNHFNQPPYQVEIFERKLGGKIPKDKSPYSCDMTFSTNNMKKNKINLSYKDYSMISKIFGSMKRDLSTPNQSIKENSDMSPFISNNTVDDHSIIVPLWSLDRNNKARLPYPRSSISSQSTQTVASSTHVLNVSQTTSESLLYNTEESLNPLRNITEKMKATIYAATEAGIVLMNTVFKYDLTNPASTEIITEIPQFLQFVNAPNELQALDKMAEIYELASTKIKSYKQKLKSETDAMYPENTQFAAESSQLLNLSSVRSEIKQIVSQRCSRANPQWDFDSEENRRKIDVSIASEQSGELKEIVSYDRCQYKTVFTGTDNNINEFSTASCQSSCPATLKPQLLLQMIERSSSHSMNRIVAAKFCCNSVSNRIALTAQHFLDGKYSKAINENQFTKLLKKFRAINVVSGILQQISHELENVCVAIQKAIKLDINEDNSKNRHIPGISRDHNNIVTFPVSAKLNAAETIKILQNSVHELHNILKTGENSLEFVNRGTQIKKHDKTTIKTLLNALRYLVSVKDMDFGTMVMTLYCNTLLLQNLTDIVPSIDSATRFKLTASVADLYWGLHKLAQSAKTVNTIATYISVNTFRKIHIINSQLKKQLAGNKCI